MPWWGKGDDRAAAGEAKEPKETKGAWQSKQSAVEKGFGFASNSSTSNDQSSTQIGAAPSDTTNGLDTAGAFDRTGGFFGNGSASNTGSGWQTHVTDGGFGPAQTSGWGAGSSAGWGPDSSSSGFGDGSGWGGSGTSGWDDKRSGW
jgi:hypothetical protein